MKTLPLIALLALASCAPKTGTVPVADIEPLQSAEVAPAALPTLAGLEFPGDARIAPIAKRVIDARFALHPSAAADAGLMADAIRVPSYTDAALAPLITQLEADIAALKALPFADLSVDEQIDVRWLVANAQLTLHEAQVEKRWQHRPSEWLEPVANSLIGMATYGADRPELQIAVAALMPGMVDEMTTLVVAPTVRDIDTASEILGGIILMLEGLPAGSERDAAIAALTAYDAHLAELKSADPDMPDYHVIGKDAYAWRLQNALLLPWTPTQLMEVAQAELTRVDAEMAAIEAQLAEQAPPTAEETAAAEALTADGLLATYEGLVETNLAALRAMDVITVPDDLPAIKARHTPAPLIPLTGDGGSMNPPPLFGTQSVGWWNVEHFNDDWSLDRRLSVVVNANRYKETWFGPYAVHEGVPGHHLQLAEVRANPDPTRTILWDNATVEGWGLYAEELFWEGGGFGDTPRAEWSMLRSYRFRIRRVIYDVNAASGTWTLQQAADWKAGEEGAAIDKDLLRAIQWPTQLIGYFAGKKQIMDLRVEVRQAQGDAYSERAFNDAVLKAGLVPMSLIRAQMLGLPIDAP
jgi:uncharacterized protein (DUF885 family)